MTALFEATAADYIRWQQQAVKLLRDVTTKGATAGLRPLMWQVGQSGIAGTACDTDPVVRETTIRAWAKLLKVELVEDDRGDHKRLRYTRGDWALPGFAIYASIEVHAAHELDGQR